MISLPCSSGGIFLENIFHQDKYFIFSLNRLVLDYIYSSRRRSEIKIRNPFKDLKLIEKSLETLSLF